MSDEQGISAPETHVSPQIRSDWNALPLNALFDQLARNDAEHAVENAFAEDLGRSDAGLEGDVTSCATISPDVRGRARIESRGDGVLCGMPVVEMVARRAGLKLTAHREDGARLVRGTRIATLEGPLALLLAYERTMLNFATLLSGNATFAARFVDETRGTRATI
jgi:nicotinate-nucleotide pyrophosphorylase (carboxylating)